MTETQPPHLIIAGVNKAGTTSLFTYLSVHPDICASNVKETCYFLPVRYGEPLNPVAGYGQFFGHCTTGRYFLESTPGYFYGGRILATYLREYLGPTHILIMLRDPVARLISFYNFKKSQLELPEDISLQEYVDRCEAIPEPEIRQRKNNTYWGIEGGYYDQYLSDWFETFPDTTKVVFFRELRDDTVSLLTGICNWLRLDSCVYEDHAFTVENRSTNFRNPQMQRLALNANKMGERFWRANPSVKRTLRRVYYAINGRPFDKQADNVEVIQYLESLYKPHNARLAQQLADHGYTELPDWLAREMDRIPVQAPQAAI